ncbi:unnamed protein product [Paramecium pentaurelia]|uniref:Uncharacterized protein n=1 Tax=Paramecium pentaurelia TaxID=43138 RepID=A0A8S1WR07_9CILI|nr:unnamed protein product [Paramecium pentaurelia]
MIFGIIRRERRYKHVNQLEYQGREGFIWNSKQRSCQFNLVYHQSDEKMISVLNTGVQILTIDKQNKKIQSFDVYFGGVIRTFNYVAIHNNVQFFFWNKDW